jgi:CXXX repeat peptide maturase
MMSAKVLEDIAKVASAHAWRCTVITNQNGIPKSHERMLDELNHRIVIPSRYSGRKIDGQVAIVFDPDRTTTYPRSGSNATAILRMRRDDLGQFAETVTRLLDKFSDVSIKHPHLLTYEPEDLELYRKQLFKVGQWLLNKEENWTAYRVDRLTDRFELQAFSECSAGDKSLAVGPDGHLYVCPATLRAGLDPCGHIREGIRLPNRHLLTRQYSLPCRDKCEALHCSRCVYLSKIATQEFCVPAENMCRLAHVELEVQAWLAQKAIEQDIWDGQKAPPSPPSIYDPYELVKDPFQSKHSDDARARLTRYTGRVADLSAPLMLDMIHVLQGRLEALSDCRDAGCVPSSDFIENDPLVYCRRKAIERYKDVVFSEGCPTIRQIEIMMHRCHGAR